MPLTSTFEEFFFAVTASVATTEMLNTDNKIITVK